MRGHPCLPHLSHAHPVDTAVTLYGARQPYPPVAFAQRIHVPAAACPHLIQQRARAPRTTANSGVERGAAYVRERVRIEAVAAERHHARLRRRDVVAQIRDLHRPGESSHLHGTFEARSADPTPCPESPRVQDPICQTARTRYPRVASGVISRVRRCADAAGWPEHMPTRRSCSRPRLEYTAVHTTKRSHKGFAQTHAATRPSAPRPCCEDAKRCGAGAFGWMRLEARHPALKPALGRRVSPPGWEEPHSSLCFW
jgi:hypothetical protein